MAERIKFNRTIERYDDGRFALREVGTRAVIVVQSTLNETVAKRHGVLGAAEEEIARAHAGRIARNLYGDAPDKVAIARTIIAGWLASMPAPMPPALAEALHMLSEADVELSEAVRNIHEDVLNPARTIDLADIERRGNVGEA